MKTFVTLIFSIITLTMFTQCASSQFDKKPPFSITKAQHQEWVGGKSGSNGTLVTIEFAEKIADKIQFNSIYFNDKSAKVIIDTFNEKTVISGNFSNSNFADKMIVMDKDPKKEFGNEVPKRIKKLPFELSENECVISYIVNSKEHFFKLDTLQKGKTIIYP